MRAPHQKRLLLTIQTQPGGSLTQRVRQCPATARRLPRWLQRRQRRRVAGLEAQRRIGQLEHARLLADLDLGVDGQPRQQGAVTVVHRNHHRIGHHIVGGGRRQPHLLDHPPEAAVRKGIDAEAHRLPGLDLADVGLVHRQFDLHLRQILGDGEQLRRL